MTQRGNRHFGIECFLAFGEAVEMPTATTGKHIWVAGEAWLRVDDVEGNLGQLEIACISLLALLGGDVPDGSVDVLPPHGSHLLLALPCQQGKADEGTEDAIRFCRLPNGAEFVVIEDAITGALPWIGSSHAAHDRAYIIVVASSVPIGDRAHDAQNEVSGNRAGVVLDVIKKLRDISAPDRCEVATAPLGQDVLVEIAPDLGCGAKLALLVWTWRLNH